MGWHDRNSGKTTHPVGQKRANAWGLCDMHGNVWEWCEDWYGAYPSGSVTDPVGSASGSSRVNRGGSSHAYQTHCRSALRRNMYYHMDDRNKFWNKIIGFRVARTLP
jgi:formylglycine-generating enzyme required for sulfatase activity